MVGSRAVLDKCGRCGGDGVGCNDQRRVRYPHGKIAETLCQGYEETNWYLQELMQTIKIIWNLKSICV